MTYSEPKGVIENAMIAFLFRTWPRDKTWNEDQAAFDLHNAGFGAREIVDLINSVGRLYQMFRPVNMEDAQ